MNIHPAFVHFPIALLFLYSVLEIIPCGRIMPAVPWDGIRRFLLYVGTAFALGAVITGSMAEDIVGESSKVGAHESAAYAVVAIFLLLSLLTYFWNAESTARVWTMKILAAMGLLFLFIAGALGSNIVYGNSVDPIVTLVTRLFGAQ